MVEVCSPAVSEDRGHTSKVDGPESLAISIRDVSYKLMYKLMNLKIILLLIHCLVDMPTSQARLSCYVREISHCPRDGVRRQMSYSIFRRENILLGIYSCRESIQHPSSASIEWLAAGRAPCAVALITAVCAGPAKYLAKP